MVATKQVPFAVVSADQIVVARSMGKKIVGIFAVYQKDPMCIITHKARGLGSLEAVVKAPGTLAIERGMPRILLGVVHGNIAAERSYRRQGFQDYALELVKPLPRR